MDLKRQNGDIFVTGKGRHQVVTLDFDDEGLQFDLDTATSTCRFGKRSSEGEDIARMIKERINFYQVTPAACTLLSGEFGPLKPDGDAIIHHANILLY